LILAFFLSRGILLNENLNFNLNTDVTGIKVCTEGALKISVTFSTPMYPVRSRWKNSEYPDISAYSRFAGRTPQAQIATLFFREPYGHINLTADRSKEVIG